MLKAEDFDKANLKCSVDSPVQQGKRHMVSITKYLSATLICILLKLHSFGNFFSLSELKWITDS